MAAKRPMEAGTAREAKYGATAAVYVIVIIAVLVMINWLANRYNKTYDATANKRYTLSEQTDKIIKDLKGDATITYIDQTAKFDQAKALLDRYANLSPKIHIKYVDYVKNPTVARSFNLKFPGTAYVDVNGKREEARSFTEEGITGAFIRAIKGGTKEVCFVQGSGEHSLDESGSSGLSRLKDALSKENYTAKAVSLLARRRTFPRTARFWSSQVPRYDHQPGETAAIQKYIENGGRGMFLLDPPLQMGRETISKNEPIEKMLASWGVSLDNNLVLEVNPMGQLLGVGPEVPLITNYGTQAIVSELHSATAFPLAQSMNIANSGKSTVEKLFSTGDRAGGDLEPQFGVRHPWRSEEQERSFRARRGRRIFHR